MASRDFLKHVVSTSEPVGSTLGDEYHNPSSNKLFKRLAVSGTRVQWVEQQQSIAVQSSGITVATGARTINFPGATIGYDSVTDTVTIQSSGIPGGANTNIQFNNSGAFAGSSSLTWNSGSSTLAITGFLTTFALSRSGNVNAATWTTTSPVFNSAAAILTDLTGSGTIALKVGHSFLSPNFASSSVTTITDAANLYVNPAVASTNTTITNNWSLYVAGNQRITGTLFSDADIQLSGSRVIDYKNTTAQWTTSGGGVVTWNGSSILWGTRVIVIPVANPIMGSQGYFDITCPTSGTVTYFNSVNVTTTLTCTAAGIPLSAWEALYYEVNITGASTPDQTRFRVVNYQNTTWRPTSGWILLAAVNGDGTNIGHLKWLPGQVNLPTTGATVTYNTGTGISSWAAGSGTVTAVSVVSANGFAGTSSGGATPALTLTTSITGMLRGNGTAISAASAGTDFLAPSGTFNLGTTSITFNRASAAQSLTGINIDGSAGTAGSATNSTYIATSDDRIKAPSDDDAGKLRFGFTSWANNNTAPYADYLHLRSYTDATGGNDNLLMIRKDAIGMRIYQQAWGSATAYSTFKDVAFTDTTFNLGTTSIALNRASAAQSLTGINIDGSAGTAGTAGIATTVTTTASTTNSAFKIPMLNTTGTAGGNFGLLLDSAGASDFTFNPSTNTLVVGVVEATSPTPATVNAIRARSNIAWQSPSATSTITSKMLDAGTLSFEGSVGQLFSITNSMTGSIFSVNDISGIPSIEVFDTGVIRLAQYGGFVAFGVSTALTATGSSQGTALLLTRPINDVTTTAASTGVVFPAATVGMRIIVRNGGVNSLNIYPASGGQINSLGTNVAFTLVSGTVLEYVAFSTTQWYTLSSTYA